MAEAGSNGRGNQSDAARLLLAAARERFAVAATDLLLPDRARLTEWQRLTAAALLTRLVHGHRGCDARPPRRALRGPCSAPRRFVLRPRADRAADPRARPGAARRRALQRPRPPGRGASLLEGQRARRRRRRIAVRAGPRRRRGVAAAAMELVIARVPPLRPLPGARHGRGRAARRAPAQTGLDHRRSAPPLYRPAPSCRRRRRRDRGERERADRRL